MALQCKRLDYVDGLDGRITLNTILEGTLVDVSINEQHTLLHRPVP